MVRWSKTLASLCFDQIDEYARIPKKILKIEAYIHHAVHPAWETHNVNISNLKFGISITVNVSAAKVVR